MLYDYETENTVALIEQDIDTSNSAPDNHLGTILDNYKDNKKKVKVRIASKKESITTCLIN